MASCLGALLFSIAVLYSSPAVSLLEPSVDEVSVFNPKDVKSILATELYTHSHTHVYSENMCKSNSPICLLPPSIMRRLTYTHLTSKQPRFWDLHDLHLHFVLIRMPRAYQSGNSLMSL